MNIIVGNNESGKSTLLEAINLALNCQLNCRPAAAELHSHLFNNQSVDIFIRNLREGKQVEPPKILIELYLKDWKELASQKGPNNSLGEDKPGISLSIELDYENFGAEYRDYIVDPERVNGIYVDEVQELAGWDLELVEALLKSNIQITLVGDHRQATFQPTCHQRTRNTSGRK